MTENDAILVHKARHTPWESLYELIEKCDSEEARDQIESIRWNEYHKANN